MSNDAKTLVILTPGFASDEADSTCIPVQQSFVRAWKKLFPGWDIFILSFQYPYHTIPYQWNGVTVFPFGGRNKGGFARLLLRRRIITVLNKIHRKNNRAGLLSFWYGECAWVGKRFADKHHLRHYCWLQGQDARKENKYPRRLRAQASELIALSDFLQDEFEKNHGIKAGQVVTPGIDTNEFPDLSPERDIDIIAAGSLVPVKQYEILVQVVAEIKNKFPLLKAVLIGGGPERGKLERLIGRSGLQSNIMLTGELPHPSVLQWMQRAKVFLHTSSYEGFGMVCLEALYAGAPVISFLHPMRKKTQNWQVAKNREDMIQTAMGILQNSSTEYKPVAPFLIEDSVKKIMELFTS